MVAQSTSVWISRLVWPTVEAPVYRKGYATTMAFAILLFLLSFVVLWFYKRDERKYCKDNGIILYNSLNEDVPEVVSDSEKKTGSENIKQESVNSATVSI